MFQSTHSLRSATITSRKLSQAATVSIHALLAECDIPTKTVGIPCSGFNPRTPCGVRLSKSSRAGATSNVSIHALLAECDAARRRRLFRRRCFNPRTPCGVRLKSDKLKPPTERFQSTHSLRSATDSYCKYTGACHVSIHALLAECDFFVHRYYLTPAVSIHALLAECDNHQRQTVKSQQCFNPRTPCGVRQNHARANLGNRKFQSTHSLRSATPPDNKTKTLTKVSIHALLAECDSSTGATPEH